MFTSPPLRCHPPWWARGGHGQTLLGHFIPTAGPRLSETAERVEIDLGDGDRLVAFHRDGSSGVVVTMFHGLAGDVDADYVRAGAATFAARGHAVLAVNHRGCGEGEGLATRPYHSGCRHDLAAALDWARARHPAAVHVGIGFSLSGNALLLLLAEDPERAPDVGIAVNPPIDLDAAARRISSGANRLYDMRFVRRLIDSVRARYTAGLLPSMPRFPALGTIRDFDEIYTAPAAGFADRQDYYARCSTRGRLAEIRTPAVILAASDDPMIDVRDLAAAPRSSSVHLHVEPHGGHMGYLCASATPLGTRRWLDYALEHWVAQAGDATAAGSYRGPSSRSA